MADRKEYFRQYHQLHKKDRRFYDASRCERRRIMEVTQHRRLKGMVVSHYSKGTMKCIECGFSDMRALTIDHINGGGVAHAKIVGNGTNFYRWLKVHNYP